MATSQRYISKELTHFVRTKKEKSEGKIAIFEKMVKILKSGCIKTSSSASCEDKGISLWTDKNLKLSSNNKYLPGIICFCDIPLEDMSIHMAKYSKFGIAFKKSFLVSKGANPVFYIAHQSKSMNLIKDREMQNKSMVFDDTEAMRIKLFEKLSPFSGNIKELSKPYESQPEFTNIQVRGFDDNLTYNIFCFLKFFDIEKEDDHIDNYYMEREWRVLGNIVFQINDVCRIIIPQEYAKRFREEVPEYIGQISFAEL